MKNKQKMSLGIRSIKSKKWKMIFPIIYLIILSLLWWSVKERILDLRFAILSKLCLFIFTFVIVVICVTGMRQILICLGSPKSARKVEKKLERIKLVDCTGNTPILANVMEKDGVLVYEFFSLTIPKEKYEKCQGELATTLNMQIISIEQGRDNQYVLVKCVSATNKLPDIIEWNDSDLSKKDFELLLGESQFGKESIDINTTPHLLIGGGSGSGKSKLLKLLLYQSI